MKQECGKQGAIFYFHQPARAFHFDRKALVRAVEPAFFDLL
jgi:hypothetical protein